MIVQQYNNHLPVLRFDSVLCAEIPLAFNARNFNTHCYIGKFGYGEGLVVF